MNQKLQVKIKTKISPTPSVTIQAIIEELRLLRSEIMLLLPHENLKEYAHTERIRRSYQKALRKYPPTVSWK